MTIFFSDNHVFQDVQTRQTYMDTIDRTRSAKYQSGTPPTIFENNEIRKIFIINGNCHCGIYQRIRLSWFSVV